MNSLRADTRLRHHICEYIKSFKKFSIKRILMLKKSFYNEKIYNITFQRKKTRRFTFSFNFYK